MLWVADGGTEGRTDRETETDRQTDKQTDKPYFIGPSLTKPGVQKVRTTPRMMKYLQSGMSFYTQ